MRTYTVKAIATVEIEIAVEANSRVEAMVLAEGRRSEFERAVWDNHGTLANIEISGVEPPQ